MSNKIVRAGQKHVATTDDLAKGIGAALMEIGLGGLVVGGVAWMIPWVTLPVLLFALVVLGGVLYVR